MGPGHLGSVPGAQPRVLGVWVGRASVAAVVHTAAAASDDLVVAVVAVLGGAGASAPAVA